MRKRIIFFLFLFIAVSPLSAGDELALLHRRAEALAIGEMTLAYRLVTLTVSLSIASATDNDALLSLLENVESTLSNAKTFLSAQGGKGSFTPDILALLDETLSCSLEVRGYMKNKTYENLQKVRGCVDFLDARITELSDRFNKAAPVVPAPPAPSSSPSK